MCVPCEGCGELSSPRSVTIMTQNATRLIHMELSGICCLTKQVLGWQLIRQTICLVLFCFCFVLFVCFI